MGRGIIMIDAGNLMPVLKELTEFVTVIGTVRVEPGMCGFVIDGASVPSGPDELPTFMCGIHMEGDPKAGTRTKRISYQRIKAPEPEKPKPVFKLDS